MSIDQKSQTAFHIMAKPTGYRCNLKCEYCFYLEKEHTIHQDSPTASQTMSDATLKRYIREYIRSQHSQQIDFSWQGGEPTLAGLDFYRNVVAYQQKYADGKHITNSFQTNAIGINRQWAEFFAKHNFLVGISVDGLQSVHDAYRVSVNGNPTFERVQYAIKLLKEFGVEFNTLTVINDKNWDKGRDTYLALKNLGVNFMQFIPLVELSPDSLADNNGHYTPMTNPKLMEFSVPAHGYGRFMADIFDEWCQNDVGRVFIRMFDSILAVWMGYPASVCVQSKDCGQAVIIEANGDLYSCDHYVYHANRLGNIHSQSLVSIVTSKKQNKFGKAKSSRLTSECQQCDVHLLCYGGCPKHRIISIPTEKYRHNYLCPSYRHIFNYTAPIMARMADEIRKGGVAANVIVNGHKY
ncbi:anaerobic sulfatase maturase [Aeromonas veronii]|uniref:anaerobic sulfatase maturase n=1 Tax=Aeromonas veronii TaxID=654 RepID=UPI003F745F5B